MSAQPSDILARLGGRGSKVLKRGNGWRTSCPSPNHRHGNKSIALTIDEGGDGRTLLYCHAGCSVEQIIVALGMEMTDLFTAGTKPVYSRPPVRRPAPAPPVKDLREKAMEAVKEFWGRSLLANGYKLSRVDAYHDADGNISFWELRFTHPTERKEPRFLRQLPDGKFHASLPPPPPGGQPLCAPDGLPADPATTIFVTEGPKDAGTLRQFGLCAVSSYGGAKNACKSDWSVLAGRTDIRIWSDNDPKGSDARDVFARDVTAELRRVGVEPRWIDRAGLGFIGEGEGEGATDWAEMNDAATAETVLALALHPPGHEGANGINSTGELYTFKPFTEIQRRETRWLWFGQMSRGNVSILCGPPGVGKSKMSWMLAAITSQNRYFPGAKEPCNGGRVLIVSAEDSPEETISQNLEAAGADLAKCSIIVEPDFDLATGLDRLGRTLRQHEDFAMVIIDPVSAFLGEVDENKNAEVRRLMRRVFEMAQESNVAVLLISHPNKSTTMTALNRVSGSIAFAAVVRSAYMCEKDENDPTLRRIYCIKNNLGDDTFERQYRVQTDWLAGGITVGKIHIE